MYELSRTVPVNEPGKVFLSRHEVWTGLMMKARNALPYVPQMQKCAVVEQGKGWLLRDILLNNVPLRERVTFEPENRVLFERVGGVELGRIENVIGEDDKGNLTLTFAFGLTKQGIPEGTEAERAHFAPMEGAYFGAVAATLGAVRRTVLDQGRETLEPQNPRDASGNTKWIYEFFRAADSLDMDRFLALHTDDVRLTFANYPTTVGHEALRGSIGAVWSRIKAMSHSLSGAWSMHGDQIGIAESSCMYTRLDDSLYMVRPCTVLRRRGDKIEDLRIHVDATLLVSARLKGKVCIITGTGGGMGRAAAILFAKEGARVVGCDINAANAEATLDTVRSADGQMVSLHPCDMSVRSDVDRLIEFAIRKYGRIDVLYNNASMAYFAWLGDMTHEQWTKTLREELDVVFHGCQAVFPHMIKAGGGSIINVGSTSGKIAYEVLPALAHTAAKGGVIAMTKQIAMEGGKHGIRCNTISPGLVMTNQTRDFINMPEWFAPMKAKLMLGRVGMPEDIAPLGVYLASDESTWVTGADFAIDGGTTAW